ncbi:MAG: hypothetical protein LC126_10485 [Bryobacterales bacterium]|nr:hypothetical protein [Bryobacterales bacterium]
MTLFRFFLLAVLLRLYPALLAEMREGAVGSTGWSEETRCGTAHPPAKDPGRSYDAFPAAGPVDPLCQRAYVNMAKARNFQRRFAEAERAARQAVELRKLDPQARFELGVALAGQRRNLEEAADNLRMVAAEIPEAHLELSRLFLEEGNFELAMRELQAFRKFGSPAGAGQLLAK